MSAWKVRHSIEPLWIGGETPASCELCWREGFKFGGELCAGVGSVAVGVFDCGQHPPS